MQTANDLQILMNIERRLTVIEYRLNGLEKDAVRGAHSSPHQKIIKETAEFVKLFIPIAVIALLLAGKIGAGDALAIIKIAFGVG